jgi:hypothetical protein
LRTRNILPTRFYSQYLGIAGTSGDKPKVYEGDRHQPEGTVTPSLLTQDWQLTDNAWRPLGPVSEISLTKQPVLFKIDGTQPGFSKLNFVVALPEWTSYGGLPAAVYAGVKIQYPGVKIIDNADAWKCLVDVSECFEQGVTVTNLGSYVNGWAACFVFRIYGNIIAAAQNLLISVELDAFFINQTVNEDPGLGENPVDMTFTLNGEATKALPFPNPAPGEGLYGWEVV